MAYVFISYSKSDIAFARHLRSQLQNEGFAVWMDEIMLVPSERWWRTIEQNILTCSAFIVIMSPASQASDWVERELLIAEDQKKPIFPVLLEGKRWSRLANIQYSNMSKGVRAILPPALSEALQKAAPRFSGQAVPPPLPAATPLANNQTKRTRQVTSPLMIGLIALLMIIVIALVIDRGIQNNAILPLSTTLLPSDTAPSVALLPTTIIESSAATVSPDTSTSWVTQRPTYTATDTLTASAIPTHTYTPSVTPEPTNTPTDTLTPSATPTETMTPSATPTDTQTPSITPPPTNTPTDTLTPSATPTSTFTPSTTPQPTRTPSNTSVPTRTRTPTPTIAIAASPTPRIFSSLRVSEQLFEHGRMY